MPTQAIKIGSKAPVFTLPNKEGKKMGSKDLKGHWTVLYFYSKDGTSGCTTEACEFTSAMKDFKKMDAQIVGVSPDPPESHREFAKKNRLKMHLLSDPTHRVMPKFGAWGTRIQSGRQTQGPIRSTVLLDPQGRVAYQWKKVRPTGHAEQVRQKLEEIQETWSPQQQKGASRGQSASSQQRTASPRTSMSMRKSRTSSSLAGMSSKRSGASSRKAGVSSRKTGMSTRRSGSSRQRSTKAGRA